MSDPSGLEILGRLLPSLGLIIGGLLLVRWWAQRGRGGSAGGIRVLARSGLSKGSTISVVQVGRQRFLVGSSEHSVSLLSELPIDDPFDPVTPASPDSAVTDAAPRRPALPDVSDRPWMGLVDRLRSMTVRSHLERPMSDEPSAE